MTDEERMQAIVDIFAERDRLRAALVEVRRIALCRTPALESLDRASIATIADDALRGRP